MSSEYTQEIILDLLTENEIIKNASKRLFYDALYKLGINLYDVDEYTKMPKHLAAISSKKKSSNELFHKFNMVVKQMYDENKIGMIDIAIYLYTDFLKMRQVMECFNEQNKHLLRQELATQFNIPLNKNTLKYFLF